MPIIRIEDVTKFVGMGLAKARAEIGDHGYDSRVVHVDGRTFSTKHDYDPLRVNLYVTDGKITKADIG